MSKNFRSGDSVLSTSSMNINDLLMASRFGAIKAPLARGRRARKRANHKKMMNASLLAPLLAAEGCLSVGKEEIPLGAAADNGAAADASAGAGGVNTEFDAVDDHVHTAVDQPLLLSESQLQSNDIGASSGGHEIVRVFDAEHGTVFLDDSGVRFVPNSGFVGVATFSYEVRDANGEFSTATVEIIVGDVQHDEPANGVHLNDSDGQGQGSNSNVDEKAALLDLVPVGEATHVAVNNGSWFDPNTWANGEVPTAGSKVLISDGVTVTYDGESAVSIFTVRVDGTLEFATDKNTFIEVDTLVVSSIGTLTIGTADNPVAPGVEAVIQIADNGPIDVTWDTLLLSRGVISQGTVEIYGAEKDTFLKVAIDAMAGDTSLTLEAPPDGWAVGDRLVLTGTKLPVVGAKPPGSLRPDLTTEDEELIITAINGNVITFDRPLAFDHDTPRADLKAYVANYTRNVRFITENADDLPVYQRGHVMFMKSDEIDVRYAEFTDLGRTDKSVRAFDVAQLDSVEFDTNVKARYPLHLHRAGVNDQDNPAELVGNAIWGSPGWGVVQHDSNAILADNAVYNAFGAAFSAETGNETGRWVDNIAIKSIGVAGFGFDNNPKFGPDVSAFDLGRTGAGFWLQSRMVDLVDNVAAGIPSGQGFIYFSRGPNDEVIRINPENAPLPESLNYADEANIYVPSISQFVGNEAFAVGSGFYVVKPGPNQGHDARSVIEDFTAWETRFGIHLEYTGRYTLKDIDLIGADNGENGLSFGQNTFDFVVNNANIDGFDTGVRLAKTTTFTNFDGNFRFVFIDVDISGANTNYTNVDANDQFLTAADLVAGRLEFVSGLEDFPLFQVVGAPYYGMNLPGVKTDSIGTIPIGDLDPQVYRFEALGNAIEEEGYWTLPDGRAVTVFERYFSDRATGELIKQSTFIEIPDGVSGALKASGLANPVYHGVLDVNSAAPVATDDTATVSSGSSVIIDALANDFDPEGDPIAVDGFVHPTNGRVDLNDDGTITYTPDPNFSGTDQFWYWVEDDNGNFTKGEVFVTVDI
jgi:Bacterial Ig domain/G8 domain